MSNDGTRSGPRWVKSSLSFSNGNCVEVAGSPHGTILVRNSRFPNQVPLEFTRDEWSAFVGGVKKGEFDRPGHE